MTQTSAVTLDAGELAKARDVVVRRMREITHHGEPADLIDAVRTMRETDAVFFTDAQRRTLLAVVNSLAAFLVLSEKVDDLTGATAMAAKADPAERAELEHRQMFSRTYALFVAAGLAVARTRPMLDSGVKPQPAKIDLTTLQFEIHRDKLNTLRSVLAKLYRVVVAESDSGRIVTDGQDLVNVTVQFFDELAKQCAATRPKYGDLVGLVEESTFLIDNVSVCGFEVEPEKRQDYTFDVSLDDVVGNIELVAELRAIAHKFMLYSREARMNPCLELGELPRTYLIDGPPGTGKTTSIKGLLALMSDIARAHHLGLEVIEITGDVKDKFYGETGKNLTRKLDSTRKTDKVFVVLFEDIDLLMASRDDPSIGGADKDLLNAIMNYLEGVGSRDIGNTLVISTTNRATSLESALRQRHQVRLYAPGPQTPEEFVRLFKLKLKKGLPREGFQGYIDVSDGPSGAAGIIARATGIGGTRNGDGKTWLDIGTAAARHGFTGRDVAGISKTILARASRLGTDLPAEAFDYPHARKLETLAKFYSKVTGNDIMAVVEEHAKAETRYHQDEEDRRVHQVADRLRAERAALETLAKEKP